MPAVVHTFINCTGGSAKSSTAAALSVEYAKRGKKVLAVDIDSQRDLSKYFGFDKPETIPGQATIVNVIKGEAATKAAIVSPEIDGAYRGVDVLLGASHNGASLERWIASAPLVEMYLVRVIRPVLDEYDLILVDGPGSMGIIGQGAAMVATYIFAVSVPLMKEVRGVTELDGHLIDLNQNVREQLGLPPLAVDGIIFGRSPVRTPRQDERERRVGGTHYHQIIEATVANYQDRVLTPFIRTSIQVPDAYAAQMPINIYDPNDNASVDYADLATTIEQRGFTEPRPVVLSA
jgi:chromosome partitioning protein